MVALVTTYSSPYYRPGETILSVQSTGRRVRTRTADRSIFRGRCLVNSSTYSQAVVIDGCPSVTKEQVTPTTTEFNRAIFYEGSTVS